jgi:DNA-directed RNA polymerase subunit RPC12/RpoP
MSGAATLDRCATCGALVDVEDLFCANCGTEVPDARAEKNARLTIGAKNFECRGCGATMNYDATARSLKCPFCGSVDLVEDETQGILAPEFVVPFAIDRAEAEFRLRAFLGSSFWHPNDLRVASQLTELRPVYVPFWIFTTKVRTHWTADTSQTPAGARADWYPLCGYREGEYTDLWIPAGEGISPAELFAVMPFDPSMSVPPERVDLADVTVEQFSVSRRYARPLAQGRLEVLETESVSRDEVPGRSRNVRVNVLMEGATSRPALAPVYVMAYRYRERVYRYVLNGQSGQSTGTAPVSAGKIAGLVAAVVLLVVIILLLLALR